MISTKRWEQIEVLFARVLELPVGERTAFIEAETASDPALRKELETLVAHAMTSASDTDGVRNLIGEASLSAIAAEQHIGRQFDRYHLTQMIGEGGMGIVYLAQRNDGEYKRRVAIKLLRPGMATPSLVARLRDERQVLATLDHPGIVRLLDGGTTPDGLPYLVMEHVEGASISTYSRDLSIRQRVELVVQVANALQYAHQKLVVHRDVKPSNILVDARGIPKLLDFGIAKVLDIRSERESATRTGMAMFTPEYASPEQVRGETITVASDVYALGAVLYELLTHEPPQRAGKSLAETLANICDREPRRPSIVAPQSARRELVGDLDSVTLRALQKDPRRRYQSAAQLADDLHRYLDGMPVDAHEATRRYRARKFVARHRGKLAIAVGIASALTTAVAVSLVQAHRADVEAQQALLDKRALLRERGLQELAAGRPNRAIPYLVEAMREGDESTAMRLLITEALLPYSREIVSIPIEEGTAAFVLAPDESRFAVLTMSGALLLFGIDGALRARVETTSVRFGAPWSKISFSSDGTRVVVRNDDGTVYVWNVALSPPRQEFVSKTFAQTSDRLLTFNAEGTSLVAAGAAGIAIVEIATGSVLSSFKLTAGELAVAAATPPAGGIVALGMNDGRLRLWSRYGDSQLFAGHSKAITALAFTKDGSQLASGSDDGTVRIWDLKKRQVRHVLAQHRGPITAIEFGHEEMRIATASVDGTAVLWDLATGKAQVTIAAHSRDRVRSIHFSAHDDYVVTTGDDATFRVWTTANAEPIAVVEANAGAGTAGFSAPGARDARIFADGSRLLSLEARYVKISRVDRSPLLFDLDVGIPAAAASYSPGEREIAVVGGTQLAFWDVATRTERVRIEVPGANMTDVSWNARGDQVVVVGENGLARIYNMQGELVRRLEGHRMNKEIFSGSWSPNGKRILTASQDGFARVWDAETGKSTWAFEHKMLVRSAAWRPDGMSIATTCRDGKLRVWDAVHGRLVSTIDGRGMKFLDVVFSPDGTRLAATGRDGDAGIWNVSTGAREMPLEGHNDVVVDAAWNPKGDLLATTADNGVIALWDPVTGAMLVSRTQAGEPLNVTWNGDGTHILVASNDGHLRAWSVSPTHESVDVLADLVARHALYRLVGTRIERMEPR